MQKRGLVQNLVRHTKIRTIFFVECENKAMHRSPALQRQTAMHVNEVLLFVLEWAVAKRWEGVVATITDGPSAIEVKAGKSAFITFFAFRECVSAPIFAGVLEYIDIIVIPNTTAGVGANSAVAVRYFTEIQTLADFAIVIDITDESSGVVALVGRDLACIVAVVGHPILTIAPVSFFLISNNTANVGVGIRR